MVLSKRSCSRLTYRLMGLPIACVRGADRRKGASPRESEQLQSWFPRLCHSFLSVSHGELPQLCSVFSMVGAQGCLSVGR